MIKLIPGDNLKELEGLDASSVDLIYLDPPYNSGRNYNVAIDGVVQEEAYQDTWTWGPNVAEAFDAFCKTPPLSGVKAAELLVTLRSVLGNSSTISYLTMMVPRLVAMHRVLKSTGSLYLHCDPTASHYLKLQLDAIFGAEGFRGEIIWKRTSSHNKASRRPGPIHDTILLYTKSGQYTWNPIQVDATEAKNVKEDADGRKWIRRDLTGPGTRTGESGAVWRNTDPGQIGKGRHWAIPDGLRREYKTRKEELTGAIGEQLDKLDMADLLLISKGGVYYKHYLDWNDGKVNIQDVWTDIAPVRSEGVGFDGEKPLPLLERIIMVSSNRGDVVLDPFLGTGTTIVAAHKLGRGAIGIEREKATYQLVQRRLEETFGSTCYSETLGEPVDIESARALADRDEYEFQCWVVRKLQGIPRKRGPDGGVDGDFLFGGFPDGKYRKGYIQVTKGSSSTHFNSFCHTVKGNDATVGIYVAFSDRITRGMRSKAVSEGTFQTGFPDDTRQFQCIQIVEVEGLFNRQLTYGGVKVPAFITTPSKEVQSKQSEREGFNSMLELCDELEHLEREQGSTGE
jgi:site-specific DNA-methyltransferase (adenine-specific)